MEDLNHYFQGSDIWKAAFALTAGLILGYERERKDKSAGLKTISIITVGSALFAILSQNYSGKGDSYSIAAGIISGIGFLGAGVIFKEGFTIYGLTTAGVIWVSAAIGMSIGFGEFYIALLFLITTLCIIYTTQLFGRYLVPNNSTKGLRIEIRPQYIHSRHELIASLKQYTLYQNVTRTEKLENEHVIIELDIHVKNNDIILLEDYLFNSKQVLTFSF